MRYEDASQSGSSSNENPVARDDADALAAGSRGPATGNVISGSGTLTGASGADLGAEHAHIVSVSGQHGSDSSFSGGKLVVDGQFGRLSIDAEGNYSYLANKGAPEASRDHFTYKLADAQGHSASAILTIEIGKSPTVVQANARQVVPGPDGVVVLPAGVELSDVHVVGRNLVIDLPDGTQMLIIDGAVFVPQLVLGDVEVPATSLAALLIGSELRPAAGSELDAAAQSGGGNFEVPLTPLDPGVSLGDLIPPTELAYVPPDYKEVALLEDSEPSILIQTPDQPAGIENATANVNESALPARGLEPAGSNSASTSESTVGTIVYTSLDAPNVITIGGVAIVAVGQVIAGTYGSLIITSIADGAIGYSYTLADNTIGDATSELFTVVITDNDGDQDSATLTISIVDDVPTARDDSATQSPENASVLVNVMANDTVGADGVNLATGVSLVPGSLSGSGSLVYNSNGTFTYTPSAGEEGTVTFRYQIVDGDGDPSSALVTINLAPDSTPTILVAQGSDTSVDEAALSVGSNPGSNGEFAAGTLVVTTGNDTVGSLVVNGVNVTNGGTVTSALGVLTITGSPTAGYSYSYQLTAVTTDVAGAAETDSFAITVTDSDGDPASTALVIDIVDDVPTARDDSATQSPENASVLVNVMANDTVGADGVNLATGVSLVPGSLSGSGSLVYNSNGTFTYTPSAGEEGTVTFRYQIVDGDGDPSSALVTINLAPDSTPTILVAQGSDTSVDEAALSVGSNPGSNGEFAAGTLVVTTGNDTVGSLVVNGVNVTNGGTVTSALGVLTITGSPTAGYSYSYQLTAVTTDVAGAAETDSFAITVTDSDGDPASTALVIDIVDDVPTARDDSATQSPENASVLVNVMANDTVGADGVNLATGVSLVPGSLSGSGSLVYNSNGTFTYTPSAGEEGTVTFRYQIVDGDGDPSSALVTINLAPDSTPTILVAQGSDTSVDEAALSVGSNPGSNGEFAAGTLVVTTGNDTVGSLVVNGVNVTNGGTVTSALGVLTITGSPTAGYSYSYQLTAVTTDVAGAAETDSFAITVTDSDGDAASTALVIGIVDDVPTARDDSATQSPENASVTVNVVANDTFGADGVNLNTGVELVAGSLSVTPGQVAGSVVDNGDGTFTYVPSAGQTGTVTFQYRIIDGDSDPSVATVTINLAADSTPTISLSGDTSVDENALPVRGSEPAGSSEAADGNGTDNDDPDETATGTITLTSGGDTVASLVIVDKNGAPINVTAGGTVQGNYGVLTITVVSGVYNYSYTLADNTVGDTTSDTFAMTVTDSDGDAASTALVIGIVDDVPTARDDSATQSPENASVTVNVVANDTFGADGVNLNTGVELVAGSLSVTPGQVAGSVVDNGDGTFTYVPSAGQTGTVTFQYRIIDGDSDPSVATVTINLAADSTPTISLSGDTSVDENALPVRGSEPAGSSEAADGNGTDNDDPDETATGTITLTSGGDTVASLVIVDKNGAPINVTAGGTVQGNYGVLTITVVSGVYNYSYTLADNTVGDTTSDTFAMTVTDSDGDAASTALVIGIVDDVPTARDDSATQSPENASVTVNVVANDTFGADGVNLSTGVELVAGSLSVTPGQVAGSVVDNGDGTFTYVPSAGQTGTVTFQYRIIDGDSDPSVATVTINLAADSTPTISLSGDTSVDENALPVRGSEPAGSSEAADGNGTDNDDPDETATGTITLTSGGDTVASLVIVDKNGAPINVTAGGTVQGNYGVLTITVVSGVYNYSYTLADNTVGDTTSDTFAMTVTDSDGDAASTALVIGIVDDVPTARDDSATQSPENASVTVNVVANDTFGADGVNLNTGVELVAGSLSVTPGQVAGSVVDNGDGTFTYVPSAGQTGTVTFQYRIIDGDSDPSVATVTINLAADSTPTVSVTDLTVDEQGLPLGTGEQADFGLGAALRASNNSDTSETSSAGTISISTGGDSLSKVEIQDQSGAWIDVTAATTATPVLVQGTHGTLTVMSSGGVYSYTYTLTSNYSTHPDTITSDGDGIEGIADPLNGDAFAVRVSDSDGDTTSSTPSATAVINVTVLDDAPAVYSAPAPLNIINSGTVSGTANFDFAIGADQRTSYSSTSSDFTTPVLTGTVGGTAIGSPTVTWSSESASQVVYNISFTYTASGAPVTETGTLVIDKVDGSYTVDLASPIQSNTLIGLANNLGIQGYDSAAPYTTPETTNPDVSVVTLSGNLFVQFQGFGETGSGTGANNLKTSTDQTLSSGDDQVFVPGEVLVQAPDYVTIQGLGGNGVHGDTMGKGEVLDFDLYTSNPYGNTSLAPTGQVSSLYLILDGVSGNEDLIVILKLYDTVTHEYTTKAVYVDPSDFILDNQANTGQYASLYPNMDNNDAAIVIESNDYNTATSHYVIIGAQITATDEGIIGSAIDLNGAVDYTDAGGVFHSGATTAAPTTFAADVNDTGFKIKDIGFTTVTNTAQSASLNFALQLIDADGDTSAVQNLAVTVGSGSVPVLLDTNHDGVISYLGTEAGVAYDYNGDGVKEGTAWVAPGDSILVRDADGNGTVSNASEFVFGGSGQTDLEALHAQYGEQLDASDAGFVQFMVWNDANSNGIADAGELHSLTDAGIVSISLVSDGHASSAANGDVAIAGEGRFAFVNDNGETKSGLLADAAFRTVDRGMEQAQRIGAAANSAALVTAAVAAVGLAASQAAAHGQGQPANSATIVVEPVKVESHVDGGTIAMDQAHSRTLLGNETRLAADDHATTSHSAGLAVAADVKVAIETPHDSHELSGLLAATDSPALHDAPASPIAPMIVIPTIEGWQAAAASEDVAGTQRAVTVDKVIAEALDGGAGGGDVDTILAALPNTQGGANPALEALASHADGGVSAWDMGLAGHLSASLAANILTDMTAFHHDAVQPAVNG